MATGIKVTPQDPAVGAKEMSKLHLSKPPEEKDDDQKQESKRPRKQEQTKKTQPETDLRAVLDSLANTGA